MVRFELDHDACLPVNGFTPNRLILTFFNENRPQKRYPVHNLSRYQSLKCAEEPRLARECALSITTALGRGPSPATNQPH
jgi:hypothetical protein